MFPFREAFNKVPMSGHGEIHHDLDTSVVTGLKLQSVLAKDTV